MGKIEPFELVIIKITISEKICGDISSNDHVQEFIDTVDRNLKSLISLRIWIF